MKHIIWALPIIYFSIAWFFPWEYFQWKSTIAISYVFDVLFILTISGIYKLRVLNFNLQIKTFLARLVAVLGCSIFALFLINLFGVSAPFKYIDNLAIQILFLAPVVEEFIFRHAFYGTFQNYFDQLSNQSSNKTRQNLFLNSFLFSISHLPGVWFLPEEFRGFIFLQLVYTFVLGWICSKSRLKSGSVFEPIILHFIFNFIFYIAVKQGVI